MTLLEVLVAIAILTLVTGLAFPELGHTRATLQARRTGLLLAADLQRAHASAIRTDSVVGLAVIPGGQAYRVQTAIRAIAAPLRLSGGPVWFFPDGTVSGGQLVLRGGEQSTRIAVDPTLGNIVGSGF